MPALRPQAVDLSAERFSVYVPAQQPSQGYGLMVFIPPWQDAHLPPGWATVLDAHGMIFVSAAKSGNEENVLDRRIPLALLGAYNVMQRYPINPDRVYIGGFSGGSRVALRTALGLPRLVSRRVAQRRQRPYRRRRDDCCRPMTYLPNFKIRPAWYMSRDRKMTGISSTILVSRDSMKSWCVFGVAIETMYRVGHEIAAPYPIDRALTALDRRTPVDSGKLSVCRARIAKDMAADLQRTVDPS